MYIFFIQSDNGLINIGIAQNVQRKLKSLQFQSPCQLNLLHMMEGTKAQERKLSLEFKKHLHHGKWYNAEPIVHYINNLPTLGTLTTRESELPQEFRSINKKTAKKVPTLSQWHEQIILGSLLGYGGIACPAEGKNHYFTMRQSKKIDKTWLLYKAEEMNVFARHNSFYEDSNSYYWSSVCHPEFNRYREMCYSADGGGKKVTMDWLDTLRDIGLAIWFGDKGECTDKGDIFLKTSTLKNDGEIICKYFNEIGIKCNIQKLKIVFSSKEKFLKVIAHRMPSFMLNKFELFEPLNT